MIFHPVVLALLIGSFLTCGMLLFSLLRREDPETLGPRQRERSPAGSRAPDLPRFDPHVLRHGLPAPLPLPFCLHGGGHGPVHHWRHVRGGSLHANLWGYPALILKIITFLLAGIWLIVNYTDNIRGYDYPLIKKKYALLLIIAPFGIADMHRPGKLLFQSQPGRDHLLLRLSLFAFGARQDRKQHRRRHCLCRPDRYRGSCRHLASSPCQRIVSLLHQKAGYLFAAWRLPSLS